MTRPRYRFRSPAATFWCAFGLNFAWINVSETARYFLVVKPAMARDFAQVPGITPASPAIAILWTVWDTLLIGCVTAVVWLVLERFGPTRRAALGGAALIWTSVFVLLWLGLHNMGLARPATLAAALPLAFVELAVAAEIVRGRFAAATEDQPLPSSAIRSGTAVL